MKRQTAVEWLIKEFNLDNYEATVRFAKEIERQQIIQAHGNKIKKLGGVTNQAYILTGEEYYNEQFKK
jgi:hypothetical protein